MNQFSLLFEHPDEGRRYLTIEYTDEEQGEKYDAYLSPEMNTPLTERKWIASVNSIIDNPVEYVLPRIAELGYTPVFDRDIYTVALMRGKETVSSLRTAMRALSDNTIGDVRLLTVCFYDPGKGLRWDDEDAIVLKVAVREESENKYRIVLEIVGENGTRYCDFECAPDCMIEKIADDLCEMTTNLKKYGIMPASLNVLGD